MVNIIRLSKLVYILTLLALLASCNNPSTAQDGAKTTEIIKDENTTILKPERKESNSRISMDEFVKKQREANKDIVDTYPYNIELKDAEGNIVNSKELLKTGKPTILLFWLTTCPPCQRELKEIKKKYATWEKELDFNLYAISTDFAKNYERFSAQVLEQKYPWESYNDVNRQFRLVMPGGLNGLPQSFVLDKEGKIVLHKRKYKLGDEEKLIEMIKSL